MLDLDLTSPGHSSSKQMPPNERPTYLYIWANSGQNLFIFCVCIDERLAMLTPNFMSLTQKPSPGERAEVGQSVLVDH